MARRPVMVGDVMIQREQSSPDLQNSGDLLEPCFPVRHVVGCRPAAASACGGGPGSSPPVGRGLQGGFPSPRAPALAFSPPGLPRLAVEPPPGPHLAIRSGRRDPNLGKVVVSV